MRLVIVSVLLIGMTGLPIQSNPVTPAFQPCVIFPLLPWCPKV
jgi:hypothetical protein